MSDLSKPASPPPGAFRSLLDRLRDKREELGTTRIGRVRRDGDSFPLSFAQQRLWFIDQLDPGNASYNIFAAVRLAGYLDAGALEQAIGEIVRRHESLRTTFRVVGDSPAQVVAAPGPVPLSIVDLSASPDPPGDVRRVASAEANRPFDLAKGPLLRTHLLRLGAEEHVILLTMHHIVSDGWSLGILIRELVLLYEAFSKSLGSPLPELPIQYVDFAHWQREWLHGEALANDLAYWRRQLAGTTPVLRLPADRPAPAERTSRGSCRHVEIPGSLYEELKELGRREGATLFVILLTAFQTLLHRYSGEEDVWVGSPIANRRRVEIQGLIGFFVNTLVLRSQLGGEQSFRQVLSQARETALEAYGHQDLPFERLVEELQPDRVLGHASLFQAVFAFENTPAATTEIAGLAVSVLPIEREAASFDLTFNLIERNGGIDGLVEYSADLFEAPTALRMIRHYESLLRAIVADAGRPLASLPLLSPGEIQQLTVESNDTRSTFPDACVHRLFDAQADATPGAVALVDGESALTYGELRRRANRLAHHLRGMGAGPETFVGVCLERSADAVISLLAVLKAGAAFAPLDPSYPSERLAFMLADTAAPVLVTTSELLPALHGTGARAVVCLDRSREDLAGGREDDPAVATTPENLAYVMYTSGSTGRPKGVGVTHRNIVRLVRGTSFARFSPEEVFLQFAPISFDASTLEIWGPLLNGGRLVVFPPGTPSLAQLGEALERHRISTLWLTAGLFHQMVEEAGGSLRGVRQLLAGGDALSVPHVSRALAALEPGGALINGYGPTEGTTFTTCHPMREPRRLESSVPIGRPIANARVHLVDPSFTPVPYGVAGELLAGGDGLARGYLNRPDLTAEKFVPDPFGEPGSRLYRTGDLARYLSDGTIEFLGRIDHQVKVRGFRVELGEIEAALAQLPGIRDCVVVAREDVPGSKQLVAYAVSEPGELADARALRRRLEERLPDYMVPSALVFLEALPLNPNGKVDRRALPAPDRAFLGRDASYVAPRKPSEELLAALWAEVLGVEQVSVHDDFFAIGGHSLLATKLMSRVRGVFQVDLPLRELFEAPTVADFAASVEAAKLGGQGLEAPPILPVARDRDLPLSFAQERLWFLDQLEPESPVYNVPYAVALTGALDVVALARALDDVVARHEVLRTTFRQFKGKTRPVQVIDPPASRSLPVADLAGMPAVAREPEVLRLVVEEARRPFDLRRGPMLRASLLRLADREHVALLTMHHIASDGWSMEVLIRDLGALYRAHLAGERPRLAELPVQYADFSVWQREWLSGEVLAAELAFWRSRLGDSRAALDLPTDHPRPAVQTSEGSIEHLTLPAPLGEALEALSRREGATLFMTGLAAFLVQLQRASGQAGQSVGTPIAGRNRLETEDLIGFFVNTLVLRADLSGDPEFRSLLAQAREVTLAAHAHQDLPFEKLVEELAPERSLSHTPLFQVMFVLRNEPAEPIDLPGLTLDLLTAKTGTTKFDLVLSLYEGARSVSLGYRSDLFERVTVQRLLGHYRRLLEGIVESPGARLSLLPLLTAAERAQLLVQWNDTGLEYPRERCLHELFEAQAERTPEAPAVVFEGQVLTYRELNRRANQLAHFLRSHGVGPEVPVGIFMERSHEMIVALYGILKAGGLYVALAPNFPKDRLSFMFEEARVPVLLTQERLAGGVPALAAERVAIDRDWERIGRFSDRNPDSWSTVENAAYMIYTSGSTGKPKGVVVEHRQVLNFVESLRREARLEPGWSFAMMQPPAVDSSKTVIYPPLLSGGCLHVISEERATDPRGMREYFGRHRIDLLKLAPSHLAALLNAPEPERVLPARCLIFGGEPSQREWALSLLELGPHLTCFSNYGPTETTVGSSMYPLACGREVHGTPLLPLGRPFPNTRYYVLDRDLNPVPVGVPGEIFIGGWSVTRGYLHRPGLTAERYVPDPFSGEPGARLYRSGDLARYLSDGDLESLGRIDHQVKIRGFRIELGEIEATLGQHPAVAACVVTVDEAGGDKRLAAFLVPEPGEPAGDAELRAFLKEKLPEYMVPAVFVHLAELPRSVHGKVDRRALVVPAGAGEEARAGLYEPPRDETEERLALLWADLLKRERVGIQDNFFEIGGHSLLATQLVSRMRDALGVELPLRHLFEFPTVASLAESLAQGRESVFEAPSIRPAPRDRAIPLSFAQERLWFLDQLEPGSPSYNIPANFQLAGRLSPPALERSLSEVVRRHEALRTSFREVGGEPVQVIASPAPLPMPVADLSGLAAEARGEEVERLRLDEARRPFDLRRAPLVRMTLVRLAEREHRVLFTIHHIVSDGWSSGVLVRELAALYEAFLVGRPSPLPELPVQYADYSVWQREWFQGEPREAQLAYWRRQLAGAPPVLDLPTDRPRPAVPSSRGDSLPFPIPVPLARELQRLGMRENTTFFMIFLMVLGELLARYGGQRDLTVGTPIAGRVRSELEPLVGFFVNTLVLRLDLAGEPTVREALRRVRDVSLSAHAHQDLPFEKLVEELAPERSLNHSPLFQVLYVFQNTPDERLALPDLELTMDQPETGTTKFDLTLAVEEEGLVLEGFLGYSTDLFDPATIARMAGHLLTLLAGLAEDPERRLGEIPLMTAAEVHQIQAWNATETDYAAAAIPLHRLIEAQVTRTPGAVALTFEGERLTYAELDARANLLAHHLRRLGVGPEGRVGLCVERSFEMVIGLLGVLKAGGAYVPLDPDYPDERLAFMLEDAQVQALLTQERLAGRLPSHGARVVYLDGDWDEIAAGSSEAPAWETSPDQLAYVIFTSGSTGRPKGAMNTHRGIVNRLLWMQEEYGLTPGDRVLQKTPFSFDVSVWEFFWPLLVGARLVIASPGGHKDGSYLVRTLEEQEITTLHFVPSMLSAFLEEPDVERCVSLKRVICSGEALPFELQQRFFSRLDAELHNLYGPTEAAVDVTFWACQPRSSRNLVPIGRPVANTRIHLFDAGLRPVPIGVAGELYIAGVQVGRGYLNRPALTAERFVPDPFSATGERAYKTGDLARRLSEGEIEYLGRIDHQVKVRGLRIELGEIEATLATHPEVHEVVVLVREDKPGDQRIVAYVVPAAAAPDPGGLRDHARRTLPDYMLPTGFVFLDRLPLSPNGKADRKALQSLKDVQGTGTASQRLAPRTPTEEILAGIWAEVLGVERIGIDDSFFDLGGHSLLATRVVSRVKDLLRTEIPLRALFEAPTLDRLADLIDRKGGSGVLAPPVVAVPRDGDLPLSFSQERLWFLDQLQPGSPAYNLPAAIRLAGRLDVTVLRASLGEIVRRHESLRTVFGLSAGRPVQRIAEPAFQPVPAMDLAALTAGARQAEARRLIDEEASRPFDLAAGPLLRAGLLRLGDEEHILLFTLHHSVSDGWSMGILVREFTTLYKAFVHGEPSPLLDLPVQYADFAVWQREWLQGDVLEAELAYWRRRLGDVPPVLQLPSDRPRPPVLTVAGSREWRKLPEGLTAAVQQLGRRQGATLFMTLLAVYQTLLLRYTGQTSMTVGTPIAGRNRLETEGLIGFFVNTLVLRADLSPAAPFTELLARVKEESLGAYGSQDIPFEKLVEDLAPERSLNHTPLFQVMFNLQNNPSHAADLPGLTLSSLDAETGATKFDLTLTLTEEATVSSAGYRTDLFDPSTIQRLLGHYQRLLEAVVAGPEARLSELPLLSGEEQAQLLVQWNDSDAGYPRGKCLHELFEEQAERTPEAPAVVFEEASLTYRELNRRANQVAHFLRSRGVGPEIPVGIFMERSHEMIVALYGILKAGGLYVALAPNFPKERLAFMFEEARVPVLLTQERLAGGVPALAADLVSIDGDWERISAFPASNPEPWSTVENAAYMIYTSGSTGKPKGVVVEHRQVLNFVESLRREASLEPGWSFAMVQPPAVDSSKTLLYPPLLSGGCLHVISEERATDPQAMREYFDRHHVDFLKIAPSHLAALLAAPEPERVLPKRCLIYGGEPSHMDWALSLLELGPDLQYFSNYGPTETTVGTSMYHLARGRRAHETPLLPLGRPFLNTRYYVLDRDLNPVPLGVPGEIYIGGWGVTRGYLDRPGLTAERYLPDPFREEPGARMYKSGDLARYLPDGDLESLGRIDHQVKIRGFRIELGEIEAVLNQHPSVSTSLVMVWDDAGTQRLAAYVVDEAGTAPETGELKAYLGGKLPEYMVPSAFVFLEDLPRTVHGKVDRQGLPAPERPSAGGREYTAPRTATEELLAAIWSEVLKAERVGIHDDFFELGGHSLLATQLVSRTREAFQVDLPLRRLFEATTIAALAGIVEAERQSRRGRIVPLIVPVPRDRDLPLSFAQERLWFLDQLQPGSPVYNIPSATRFSGRLDVSALERSFTEVVRRHESLRTTFQAVEGEPVQVIASTAAFALPVVDLAVLSEAGAELRRLMEEEARRPFDLARGPLVRGHLARLADGEHMLLLTVHHIVSDAWSRAILFEELATLYARFLQGLPSPLPEPELQYADYSVWQREWLQEAVLEEEIAYWRETLGDVSTVLELPADRPRPPVTTFAGDYESIRLPVELSEAVQGLGRREGFTLFMTLMAAFQSLLARLSGQREIRVGMPIAGRNRLETERLMGFFVNTLVLKGDLSGDPRFRDLLVQVREASLDAQAHQDLPFERLVEELAPGRSLSHTPLFQVMLMVRNTPRSDHALPGLEMSFLDTDSGTSKFDLNLRSDGDRGLVLFYKTDLFDRATAVRMLSHLRTLLAAAVAEPETRLSSLALFTDPERAQMCVEWNDSAALYPRDRCVHELFEEQVRRTPDAVAVVFEERSLTYRELNARANRLARALRERGAGLEVPVGIFMERCPEMIVAVYGILKAGATYVALASNFPADRVGFMLEESGITILLTKRRLLDKLPALGAEILCLDTPGTAVAEHADGNLGIVVPVESSAYVIYTSGSTGRPKGVVVEHRQLLNFLESLRRCADLQPGWSYAMVQPPAVDSSKTVLYPPLLSGGALHVISEELAADPHAFQEYIRRHNIDFLKIAPSHLAALQAEGDPEKVLPLRCLIFGGEASSRDWAEKLAEMATGRSLWSNYGPTETTVGTSMYPVRRGELHSTSLLPLGRPFLNTRYYVVDRDLNPVPVGVAGEIVIGGWGVTRGYLRRPDLTAERFVPDPFGEEPGGRLYRSGDLARYLTDGELEFLGRIDHQVKIRGFRIELGEIEATLGSHPDVGAVAVVVWDAPMGGKRLVAYVVVRRTALAAGDLRDFVRERLPEYMVPSSFVFLEALPLSVHGKLDRRALPVPDALQVERESEYVSPRDEVEAGLAELWEELLDIRPVSVRDNFFTLGGHSLLAVRLIARIRRRFGRDLPISAFFQGATVESLAEIVRDRSGARRRSALVGIQTGGRRRPFFCVHPVGGNVFCYTDLARLLGSDQPFYGLQVPDPVEGLPPFSRIEEMAAHYVEAVRAVQPTGPYLLGGWSMGGVIAFEMARQLRDGGEEVALLALIDSFAPLPGGEAVADEATLLARFASDMAGLAGRRASLDEPSRLAKEGLLHPLFLQAQREGSMPSDLEFEDALTLFNTFKANHLAVRAFRPALYPGRLTLFKAADSSAVQRRSHGWEDLAAGGVEAFDLPGDHYSIVRSPRVELLAERLKGCLERAQN